MRIPPKSLLTYTHIVRYNSDKINARYVRKMEGAMNELFCLKTCKNVRALGMWIDPEGMYPPMPLFELEEMSAETWNAHGKKDRKE